MVTGAAAIPFEAGAGATVTADVDGHRRGAGGACGWRPTRSCCLRRSRRAGSICRASCPNCRRGRARAAPAGAWAQCSRPRLGWRQPRPDAARRQMDGWRGSRGWRASCPRASSSHGKLGGPRRSACTGSDGNLRVGETDLPVARRRCERRASPISRLTRSRLASSRRTSIFTAPSPLPVNGTLAASRSAALADLRRVADWRVSGHPLEPTLEFTIDAPAVVIADQALNDVRAMGTMTGTSIVLTSCRRISRGPRHGHRKRYLRHRQRKLHRLARRGRTGSSCPRPTSRWPDA